MKQYNTLPWDEISRHTRREIVRFLLEERTGPKPGACPECGSTRVYLHNISGRRGPEPDDWVYLCPDCYKRKYHPVKQGECFHGQNLKLWSGLKRRARVERIRKLLPMPKVCPYCDGTKVELVSRSGAWPDNDLSDYVWVCRSHAVMIERMYPPKQKPAIEDSPPMKREPLNLELFPHWYNNTMSGTFKGSNITGLTCLAGRFL